MSTQTDTAAAATPRLKGRYTDDMVTPGMKYAYFVRSPHAHAKIKGIDATAALSMSLR